MSIEIIIAFCITSFTALFGALRWAYGKGREDLKSEQIKNIVKDYEKTNKIKNEIENLSVSDSDAFAAKLRTTNTQDNNN